MKLSTVGEGSFVVIPDDEAALSRVPRLHELPVLVRHLSGRPWVLGSTGDDYLVHLSGRDNKIVVIGTGVPPSLDAFAKLANHSPTETGFRLSQAPGAKHVLVVSARSMYFQGSYSDLRRVYYSHTGNVAMASNRANLLAELLGARVASDSVALSFLYPSIPHPIANISMWEQISAVPAGMGLQVRDTVASLERWWVPPLGEDSLKVGAPAFKDAFIRAVEAQTRVEVVSSDLSGGVDSTPVTYLANSHTETHAVTMTGMVEGGEDVSTAAAAARSMAGLRLHVLPAPSLPGALDRPIGEEDFDEPVLNSHARRTQAIATIMKSFGSTVHLTGHGGDEVLQSPLTYLGDLARRSPALSLDHFNGYRQISRIPRHRFMSYLPRRQSYSQWLTAAARDMSTKPAEWEPASWSTTIHLPAWLTTQAVDVVRARVLQAAHGVEPLHPSMAHHGATHLIQHAGRTSRLIGHVSDAAGLRSSMPLLDDAVIRASLNIAPHEKMTPWSYKSLMREAMLDVLPPELNKRQTKDYMTIDVYQDFARHRHRWLDQIDEMQLADIGLIDPSVIRRTLSLPHVPPPELARLGATFALESWLRATGKQGGD